MTKVLYPEIGKTLSQIGGHFSDVLLWRQAFWREKRQHLPSSSSSSSSLFFQVLPSFVHVGSPIPPCWVASLLGPCGLGHRLHSLCRWICTFRPSLYHSILSGFKNGRTGYGMWCPWRAFGSWTPLIRPLWGLAGSLEVSSFLDIRHR